MVATDRNLMLTLKNVVVTNFSIQIIPGTTAYMKLSSSLISERQSSVHFTGFSVDSIHKIFLLVGLKRVAFFNFANCDQKF